jgi:hypothetical protein
MTLHARPDIRQTAIFGYVTLERRVPADHPRRAIRGTINRALERIGGEFDKLYAPMVLYSVRSERQWMEQLDDNLLFRCFVGLEMDDPVWDVTVLTWNRERLIQGEVSQHLLTALLVEARQNDWLSA